MDIERASVSPTTFVPKFVQALNQPSVLRNMALPDECVKLIEPPLSKIGFSIDSDQVTQTAGKEKTEFRFSVVKNGIQRVLVLIEDEVLAVFNRVNKLALIEIREAFLDKPEFKKEKRLYVFYYSNPHCAYKTWMQGEWLENHGIQSKLIPLIELKGFPDMQITQQINYLKLTFDLVAQQSGLARKPAPKEMRPKEIQKLAGILAALPDFQDEGARGRRVFINGAGLTKLVDTFDFSGTARTVALDLIFKLLDEGLDLLLEMIKSLEDLDSADKEFAAGLLESYSFVRTSEPGPNRLSE